MPATSPPLALAMSRMYVCANSSRKSATRSPIAHSRPGAGGTITGKEPISLATALAGRGPRHFLVDDGEDALGGLFHARESHCVGDLLHCGARGIDIERHLATE